MTPPTVQFIPAPAAAGVNWDISGTYTGTFGNGALDSSPTVTEPSGGITGLLTVGVRENSGIGLAFIFDNQTNRDAFVTAYPSDFAQVTYYDSLNATNVTTNSGWVWDTASNSSRAYLNTSEWSNWQTVSQSHVSATYTITA